MRWGRKAAAALVLGLVLACGKQPIYESPSLSAPGGGEGFHPVTCVPTAPSAAVSQSGSLESVARLERPGALLATDARYVYWADGSVVRRAERGRQAWRWDVADLVTARGAIHDLAVTNEHVFWTVALANEETALYFWDKRTGASGEARRERGALSNLAARGGSLVWASPAGVWDMGADLTSVRRLTGETPAKLVAIDDVYAFAFANGSVARAKRRSNEVVTLARAIDPVAAASDGRSLFWLERGAEGPAEERCAWCANGYGALLEKTHPHGVLRRVRVEGGAPATVASELLDVEALTLERGIVWITTGYGLLRLDPSAEHPAPLFVASRAPVRGRAAPLGDALALATESPSPHVVLLAMP